MGRFIIRRLLISIPTLFVISFAIFAIMDLAPGDPTGNLPLTVPAEVREQIREALGFNDPFLVKYVKWLRQFWIYEPLNAIETSFGIQIGDGENRTRIVSWATRSPVTDIILQRIPQTLWVLGSAYVVGVLVALPVGIISAYKQYSVFDQVGTLIALIGYSVPTFFTGLLMILVFSVQLEWFPSFYNTMHEVTDWPSFVVQVRQMIMPIVVLSFFNAAQLSRFTRSSMLDNLNLDYVRTARSKGLQERVVVLIHVLRNSLIPVITLMALGIPAIFSGAIITEQIFKVNGMGQLLITALQGADYPMAQTLVFIFAILIVIFNLVADVLYGILDPRIRYD